MSVVGLDQLPMIFGHRIGCDRIIFAATVAAAAPRAPRLQPAVC
ncbi:MAG: hypothetical protein QOI69_2545, partial [Pseudonocardiales bacterium]|nr:hypothetical protein [Pseudonocardiales bacterium]